MLSIWLATVKAIRAGTLALIKPVITSTLGAGSPTPGGYPPRALSGNAYNQGFHVALGYHHQVGHLVNHNHNVRHRAFINLLHIAIFIGNTYGLLFTFSL